MTDGGPHGDAFSGRVGWGARPALLVVDLCRAYTEPDGPFALPEVWPVVEANRALVAAARAGGHPVVWTAVRYAADLADGGWFVRKVPALAAFAEGAAGGWGELTLSPSATEPVVVKQYASAFTGRVMSGASGELVRWGDPGMRHESGVSRESREPAGPAGGEVSGDAVGASTDGGDLTAYLAGLGVDTVVVTGVSTSGCVRASATDALTQGFRPQVVREACGDRSRALHDHNLADLDAKYADVVTLEDALAQLGPAVGPPASH